MDELNEKEIEKEKVKQAMSYEKIKIRKMWSINPAEKIHSTPKGDKGYSRNDNRRELEEAINEWENEKNESEK
jgi:hypothetical protein